MSETVKKSWRPGYMMWLIFGGLLLVTMSVFFGGNDPQLTDRFWHYFNPWHWPGWYAANLWFVFIGLLAAMILRNTHVQAGLQSFYASRFLQFAKTHFKKSKPNQTVVRFILHRKFGKWLLRKWLIFWKNIRIERYPKYTLILAFIAVFIVFFGCATLMEMPRLYLWNYWMFPYRFFIYQIYEPFYLGPLIEFNISGKITWRLFIAPATGLLLIVWLLRIASKSKKKRKAP